MDGVPPLAQEAPAQNEARLSEQPGLGSQGRRLGTCCVAGVQTAFCWVIAHLLPGVRSASQGQQSRSFAPTFQCEREAAACRER